MQISVDRLDDEIREVENRIALERLALDDAIHGCTNSLREAVASPRTLLAVLGVGFAVGKLLFSGGKPAPAPAVTPQKAGVFGLLTGVAGAALSLMQPKFGVGTVARWAASRAFAPKAPAQKTPPRSYSSRSSANTIRR
jgi:hypothetical protein